MNKIKYYLNQSVFTVLTLSVLLISLVSCEKEKTPEFPPEDSINVFIRELMNSWYLWYEEVPEVDIFSYDTPSELLDALVYKPVDRWSFVENKDVIDAIFEEGKSFGFGFLIRFDQEGNLRVALVYENSEAYRKGLRKGFIIETINGVPAENIPDFSGFFNDSPATYTFQIINSLGESGTLSLSKENVIQNGVIHKSILNISGSKAGYLVYDSFLGYTSAELDEAFSYFKMNSVSELIVDLRYNTGGYIDLARKMAEMIAPAGTEGEVLFSYIHNDIVGPRYDTTYHFEGNSLNLNLERVFFITTEFTASASELVINTLEPYMEVYLIGSATYGKPVGMYGFLFQNWYVYPVTVKLNNADGYGDFYEGLPADIEAEEGLDKDWGDETESNLYQAIHFIRHGYFDDGAVKKFKTFSTDKTRLHDFKNKYLIIKK